MIKLQIIGHLGKDAEVNNVNGKTVINFSVAHTEKFKDRDGKQQNKTTWVNCSQWGEKKGIAPFLKKGTQVFVEGTPEVRTYGKTDGTEVVSLSVRTSYINLLSGGKQTDDAATSLPQDPQDDLPF